ncbi:MAG TPA: thermonuclease family protein [Miltoncostaeaceae bacterium]|nr:thermonuclease family protein [Miltoncostaeaceae bacterium]
MPGSILRAAAMLAVGGALSAPALALDPADQARWQAAADAAGVPLLVPEAPGYALQQLAARRLACGGDTLGDAAALWQAPDGRILKLVQGQPYGCGEGARWTLISEVVVAGRPAAYSAYEGGGGAGGAWALDFERDGLRLSLEASFDDRAALVALAESAVVVAPRPGRALRLTRLAGQVVRTVAADTVIVSAAGRRWTVRLAGVRAPQPGRGGRAAGCRFGKARGQLKRELPRGTAVIVETDPLRPARDARGRLVAYVSRRAFAPYQVGSITTNYGLVAAGAARTVRGRFRYRTQLATAERAARLDRAGLFAAPCRGRTSPLPPPPPPEPPATSVTPGTATTPVPPGTTAADAARPESG